MKTGTFTISINTWFEYAGKITHFPFWGGALIAAIPGVGQFCIFVSVVTFIIMFFL